MLLHLPEQCSAESSALQNRHSCLELVERIERTRLEPTSKVLQIRLDCKFRC
jgi:hypothetical protein